jgi:hypothetical protein
MFPHHYNSPFLPRLDLQRLFNNPILGVMEGALNNLRNLEVVWLSGNPDLTTVEGAFDALTNIRYLYVFGTALRCQDILLNAGATCTDDELSLNGPSQSCPFYFHSLWLPSPCPHVDIFYFC